MNLENQAKLREVELNDELTKSKQEIENLNQQLNDLNKKYEQLKQNSDVDMQYLLSKKDDELQKIIDGIEIRFENDYAKFIQTYKESLAKSIQEKTNEFNEEKENLVNMYEQKLKDLEFNEQYLQKQIKNIKQSANSIQSPRSATVGVNTISAFKDGTSTDNLTPRSDRFDMQLNLNSNSMKDEVRQLGEKISELEDEREQLQQQIKTFEALLANTDQHMANEINKLKFDIEEEYTEKLEKMQNDHKYELELLQQQHKEQELASPPFTPPESSNKRSLFFKSSNSDKVNKLKSDLYLRDKHIEQLELTKQKLQQDIKQLNEKNESQMMKIRYELDEHYKNVIKNSQTENDNLQSFVQKLKKTQLDSDSLIKNLKDELNNLKSAHLDEIKTFKLNIERDKQYNEELKNKLDKLEKCFSENDEKYKQDYENLKFNYNFELNKMNTKMNEMIKKTRQMNSNVKTVSFTTSCQVS
jgi:chromosome segregation ATPase